MKNIRRIAIALIAVMIFSCFAMCAAADTSAKLDYVTDSADLLTADQKAELESKAAAMSEKYNIGVYIVAVSDYRTYSSGSDAWEAAKDIYDSYSLGWGSDHAGALMLLSMADRDYALEFNADRADYAFTEAGRDRMIDSFFPYLKSGNYFGAFKDYLDTCEKYLAAAENGHPVGEGERSTADESDSGLGILSAIPGLIVAALTGTIMSSSMHTAHTQHDADSYAVPGSLQLTRRSDMFLHRSVTRTPRQTSSSSSASSSSTHHSSGSHSGRSGKF